MNTISLSTLSNNMSQYIKEAKNNAVFVYPTDTIYGLWGIVTPQVVQKITAIKQRLPNKHYSIVAPNMEWIRTHFDVSDNFPHQRNTYYQQHGPLTLLISPQQMQSKTYDRKLLTDSDMIGIRLLVDHPFQAFVTELDQPFITTSANISWQASITSLDQLSEQQKGSIDISIDDWVLSGSGSTIIDYTSWKILRHSKQHVSYTS